MAVAELTHPTIPHRLPPGALVSAAEADIERRKRNELRSEGDLDGGYERYAFLAEHVRSAQGGVDRLLHAAARDIAAGRASAKKSCQLLYADADVIQQALALLRGRRP